MADASTTRSPQLEISHLRALHKAACGRWIDGIPADSKTCEALGEITDLLPAIIAELQKARAA